VTKEFNCLTEVAIVQRFTDYSRADSVAFSVSEHLNYRNANLNLLSPGLDILRIALAVLAHREVCPDHNSLGFEGGEDRLIEKLRRRKRCDILIESLNDDTVGPEMLEQCVTFSRLGEELWCVVGTNDTAWMWMETHHPQRQSETVGVDASGPEDFLMPEMDTIEGPKANNRTFGDMRSGFGAFGKARNLGNGRGLQMSTHW
jgi:hypothetical protein